MNRKQKEERSLETTFFRKKTYFPIDIVYLLIYNYIQIGENNMTTTIKTLRRDDLGMQWDFKAWKTDNKEFFMVTLSKITNAQGEIAKKFGLKNFEALHAEEFENFWKANEHYETLLNYWEQYAK